MNPIISPGTNPNIAAIGSPDAATVDGCVANCVAVLLSALTSCSDAFDFLKHSRSIVEYKDEDSTAMSDDEKLV